METQQDPIDVVAGAFRASAQIYRDMGSPLFAEFCEGGATDRDLLALADYGCEGAKPSQLFCAVQYLLMQDPGDPLVRYFATLTEKPLPPAGAYRELARYAREHRGELRHLLQTRTVQTTYAERCRALLPPMCEVARAAGEPLNLVEIGCSGGVLLAFDKYAYCYDGGAVVGTADAPFTLHGSMANGPELYIPRIGKRTGIDLNTIDARSEEDRRWLLALCFPELRAEQERLARALDVVAKTDMTMLEGDGLAMMQQALDQTPDPLCVFHSACLFYWPGEAKQALDELFLKESRKRQFWRIGIEPSENFDKWHSGRSASQGDGKPTSRQSGEIAITRYRDGQSERRVVGFPNADYGIIDWCGQG